MDELIGKYCDIVISVTASLGGRKEVQGVKVEELSLDFIKIDGMWINISQIISIKALS